MKGRIKLALAALLLLAALLTMALLPGSVSAWLQEVVTWARSAGIQGAAVYGLAYALLVVALVPGSVLTLGAGFLYGPVWGTLLISPASVAGATLSFLIARFFARGAVARRVAGDPRFARLDEAIGESGLKLVALLRLSPVFPFSALNYGLGVTRVRLRDYVLASFLGMLPGTFMYVYLGSMITEVGQLFSGDKPSGGSWTTVMYVGGLLATIAATVMVTRIARKALKVHLEPTPDEPQG